MEAIRSQDQGFVGAAPAQVYEVLADPASYAAWWPGARSGTDYVLLPLHRRPHPAKAERHRKDVGVHLVSPDEDLEWYLEPFDDGTIVNAFLQISAVPGGGTDRRVRRMRGAIRMGLVGLKRRLESAA